MYCKCVSAAVTTVGTPTETSAKYHAIGSIITIPNHSTCCNDIMLQQHYNVGGRKTESCLELVDIVVVRLLESDQHIVEPQLGTVLHMPRTQAQPAWLLRESPASWTAQEEMICRPALFLPKAALLSCTTAHKQQPLPSYLGHQHR
ncbi:hypothetical protein CEP53_006810 [Fusarium sp. AF-6]|nr:hypothetical protein CEP53_006810 [Fusarium sp. AF-6]